MGTFYSFSPVFDTLPSISFLVAGRALSRHVVLYFYPQTWAIWHCPCLLRTKNTHTYTPPKSHTETTSEVTILSSKCWCVKMTVCGRKWAGTNLWVFPHLVPNMADRNHVSERKRLKEQPLSNWDVYFLKHTTKPSRLSRFTMELSSPVFQLVFWKGYFLLKMSKYNCQNTSRCNHIASNTPISVVFIQISYLLVLLFFQGRKRVTIKGEWQWVWCGSAKALDHPTVLRIRNGKGFVYFRPLSISHHSVFHAQFQKLLSPLPSLSSLYHLE